MYLTQPIEHDTKYSTACPHAKCRSQQRLLSSTSTSESGFSTGYTPSASASSTSSSQSSNSLVSNVLQDYAFLFNQNNLRILDILSNINCYNIVGMMNNARGVKNYVFLLLIIIAHKVNYQTNLCILRINILIIIKPQWNTPFA